MADSEKNYGMVIDLRRCIGCHACTVTCKMENNVARGEVRSWVEEWDTGDYPDVARVKLPKLCNQCDDPSCIDVCPTGATYKSEGGTVVVNEEECIGCNSCVKNCPYDARYMDSENKVVDKCDFCLHRVKQGLLPACVSSCVAHARYFGDLNNKQNKVNELLDKHDCQGLKEELEMGANVYYIGLDEVQDDKSDLAKVITGGK